MGQGVMKRSKPESVGEAAERALRAGKTNEEALAFTLRSFPDASTSLASINWYRNKLRQEGARVPTAREVRSRREAKARRGR